MKTSKFFRLIGLGILAAAMFAACDDSGKNDGTKEGSIVLNDDSVLTQTAWADDAKAASVAFKAPGPWSSTISGTRADSPDWISIDPASGDKAGDYNVRITLDANGTTADRSAVITISCNGKETGITVTQRAIKVPTVESMTYLSDSVYLKAMERYVEIDKYRYVKDLRINVSKDAASLYDFWNAAYTAIGYCNLLAETADGDKTISAAGKKELKATAAKYRGTLYFYLKTLFGGVPVVTDSGVAELPARTAEQDVSNMARAELEAAVDGLPRYEANQARFTIALMYMQATNYQGAADMINAMIDNEFNPADLNGDGIIDNDELRPAEQAYYLASEAYLRLGENVRALEYFNSIYKVRNPQQLPTSVTMEMVKGLLTACDTGMKFLNEARWNGTSTWGKHALMPIPQKAMDQNANLVQNPGW